MNYNWDTLFNSLDIEEIWSGFKDVYWRAVSDFVPKRSKKSVKQPAWFNKDLLSTINDKRKAWKKYKTSGLNNDYLHFKSLEKKVKKKVLMAKKKYEKKLAENAKKNPRAFFSYVNNKKIGRNKIGPLLNNDGILVTDNKQQATLLNNYFASVFQPSTATNVMSSQNPDLPLLENVDINESIVLSKIKKLKKNSAAGPDGISPLVVIETCQNLVKPITKILQMSVRSGKVPQEWKNANVTPIFKKGNKNDPANHRPISLICIICKILESIIKDCILKHLEDNDALNSSQYGFVPKKSVVLNLLHFNEVVTSIMDEGDAVDVLYLDFAKAFDKVSHALLLSKLENFNIVGKVLAWIRCWLSDRKQRVILNGEASDWISVTSSVCQGSVLGPILFIIFINDIDGCIENFITTMLKFADDTKVVSRIRDRNDSVNLQAIIDNLWQWANSWAMQFNVDKCKILHIGNSNPGWQYTMNGQLLESVAEEKDLGIIMNSTAKPSVQCAMAVKKANQMLGLILRTFQCRDRNSMLQLFKTFIRPHLENAIQAWCPYTAADIEMIEKVQKRLVRQISGLQGSYEEKLMVLKLPSMAERRKRGDCIETFKMMKGFSNVNFNIWFELAARPIGPQTRLSIDPLALRPAISRLDVRKYSFSVRVPPIWNAIPLHIRQSTTINQFKNSYDKWLAEHLHP